MSGGSGNSGAQEIIQDIPYWSMVCGWTNVADVNIRFSPISDKEEDIGIFWSVSFRRDL